MTLVNQAFGNILAGKPIEECPRCGALLTELLNGEACPRCKLVLPAAPSTAATVAVEGLLLIAQFLKERQRFTLEADSAAAWLATVEEAAGTIKRLQEALSLQHDAVAEIEKYEVALKGKEQVVTTLSATLDLLDECAKKLEVALLDTARLDFIQRTKSYPFKDYKCWKFVISKGHIVEGATVRECLDKAIAEKGSP